MHIPDDLSAAPVVKGSPCPCRGCTAAYKQGRADQYAEWQDVLASTNRRAADEARDQLIRDIGRLFDVPTHLLGKPDTIVPSQDEQHHQPTRSDHAG